jgi:hypothetical protein
MRASAAVGLALLLGGCAAELGVAGREWTRPATTISQVTFDETECAREATDAGRTAESFVGGVADAVRNGIRERGRQATYAGCMRARGYQPAGG